MSKLSITQEGERELRKELVEGGYRLDTNEGIDRTVRYLMQSNLEEVKITEQQWFEMFYNLSVNGHRMTKPLQNAIADYISYQTAPKMIVSNLEEKR